MLANGVGLYMLRHFNALYNRSGISHHSCINFGMASNFGYKAVRVYVRLVTENAAATDISPLCPTIQSGSLRFRSF